MNSLVTGGIFPDYVGSRGPVVSNISASFTLHYEEHTAVAINTSISEATISSFEWSIVFNNSPLKSGNLNNIMFPVANEGVYAITLTIVDVLGNSDTTSSSIIYDVEEKMQPGIAGGYGMPHRFPIIELEKLEEKDIHIDIMFLGEYN